MAVARQTFEANRSTPTAIAKLSVGGLTVEHPQLIRKTKHDQAPHWTTQFCLLCNTKVCCTNSASGGSAIVNASLSLTEMDFKKKLTDPRYCAAFRVLVVRRASSSSSSSLSNTAINDRMDSNLFASLTEMVDVFVSQKEMEAKRRVEVYYNEEQAKVRNMHRRLKRQMSSLTEQIVKVMDAEQQHQATIKQQMEKSPALSVASSSSAGSPEFKTSLTPTSPLHMMAPRVIYVPDSPRMDNSRSPKVAGGSSSLSEQTTRDRFTAPLLTELNTRNVDDSPTDGPQENELNESISAGSMNSSNDTTGRENSLANTGAGRNSATSRRAKTFALTPPAIVGVSGLSESRNLRAEEAKGRLRGIRMRKRSGSGDKSLSSNKALIMSTTAPARSDVGFAHFVSSGMENLFEMDEDVHNDDDEKKLTGLNEEDEDEDEDEEQDVSRNNEDNGDHSEDEEGDDVGDLVRQPRGKQDIDWSSSYQSSGLTMSQSYHAPPARDWWGGTDDEITDSDEDDGDEIVDFASQSNRGAKQVEPPTAPGIDMFPPPQQSVAKKKQQQPGFYGSSLPMAIPSMGGRSKR